MAKFKLNTMKLTASGYGKSPYDCFETFLTTLQGFPIVATSMSTFYAQHPRVADHTIANLFPFLIPQIPFLLAQSNASPFSGAATQRHPNKNKSNKNTTPKGAKTHGKQKWGPKGPTTTANQFAGASIQAAVTHNPDSDLQRENYQLRAMLAATTSPYSSSSAFLPPTPVQHWTPTHDPSAFPHTWPLFPGESTAFTARPTMPSCPHPCYCWLHGWNTSHNSPQCKKMMASPEYTAQMKAAASPDGNGGNPNVGPPVILPFARCLPCLTHVSLPRPQALVSTPNNQPPLPHDDNLSAGLATLAAPTFGGPNILSRSRVDGTIVLSPPLISHAYSTPLQKPTSHISWSVPVVTLAIPPSPNHPSLPSQHTPQQQAHIRHTIMQQDKTPPTPLQLSRHNPHPQPPTQNPIPTLARLSRFSHPNPFSILESEDSADDSFTPPPRDDLRRPITTPLPFLHDVSIPNSTISSVNTSLSSTSTLTPPSPLIADSGCTSILIQLSQLPSLLPFFKPHSLPEVPFTLPNGDTLTVGGRGHLSGHLTFPHKRLPVSCYFVPDHALSHTLFGVSPLIRPEGRAVFSNTSVLFFDSPLAILPFLTGSKTAQSDLWSLSIPPPATPIPTLSPPVALFTLQELPAAKFVAYWHRSFGFPSLSTFLRALSRKFICIPNLTTKLVRRFPPLALATSYGHRAPSDRA